MESITSVYKSLANGGDKRIQHLPLMKSPLTVHLIVISYILFVTKIGPYFMKNRQPFQFKKLLLIYNLSMMLYNFCMWFAGGQFGWWNHYSYKCQPLEEGYSREAVGMAYTAYFFWFSKIVELLDTVFFTLRKKDNQVTGLHVWHHSFMVISYYWGVKHYPGGHGSFVGFLNSGVHVIMYGYYFLAALGPSVQRILWWKKYLTSMQMIQFAAIFYHSMQLLFLQRCNVPTSIIVYTMFNTVVFLFLFRDFFVKAYQKTTGSARRGVIVSPPCHLPLHQE